MHSKYSGKSQVGVKQGFLKKVIVAVIRRMICRQQRQKGDQFGGGHAVWQEDGAEPRTDFGGGMNSTSHDEVPPPEVVRG